MPSTESLAETLFQAHQECIRFIARPDDGPADAAQAYAVQALVWRRLVGQTRPGAWKVGAADRTATPVAAPVFPGRPGRFGRRGICSVGVEAEIAVRFARALPPRERPYEREEILAAIGGVHVAMEVVDARLHDAAYAGPLWSLADSLLNGALILGDEVSGWRDADWRDREVTLRADGVVLDRRRAQPPLGDLFHCLPWWAAHVGGVQAGDVVTTGAWSGMHGIGDAREIVADFAGLGQCRALAGPGR